MPHRALECSCPVSGVTPPFSRYVQRLEVPLPEAAESTKKKTLSAAPPGGRVNVGDVPEASNAPELPLSRRETLNDMPGMLACPAGTLNPTAIKVRDGKVSDDGAVKNTKSACAAVPSKAYEEPSDKD